MGKPINAYELCSRALDHSRGDVAPLLELANHQEADWLELKAACEPPVDSPREGKEGTGDYRWHAARGAIALANTHGGCLLLGIDDKGVPVGLGASDPSDIIGRKGMDAFLRHLQDVVFCPPRGWSTLKHGVIEFDVTPSENLIELRHATLQGTSVVAVLVRPVTAGDHCLHCNETTGGKKRHFLLIRQSGDVGRVREITPPREISDWEKHRQPATPTLAVLWGGFKGSHAPLGRRSYLWFATATLLILGVGYEWFHEPEPFASVALEKLRLDFYGSRRKLDHQIVQSVASTLSTLVPTVPPESALENTWNEWMKKGKELIGTTWKYSGSAATIVLSPGLPSSSIAWLDTLTSYFSKSPSPQDVEIQKPTGALPNTPDNLTMAPPMTVILPMPDVTIKIHGDLVSIRPLLTSDQRLREEITRQLAAQGITLK